MQLDMVNNPKSKYTLKDVIRAMYVERSLMYGGINFPYHGTSGSKVTDKDGNWRTYNNGLSKEDYHNGNHGYPKYHPTGPSNPGGEHKHIWREKDGNWTTIEKFPFKEFSADFGSFNWNMPIKVPDTGDKPIYEKIWDFVVNIFQNE